MECLNNYSGVRTTEGYVLPCEQCVQNSAYVENYFKRIVNTNIDKCLNYYIDKAFQNDIYGDYDLAKVYYDKIQNIYMYKYIYSLVIDDFLNKLMLLMNGFLDDKDFEGILVEEEFGGSMTAFYEYYDNLYNLDCIEKSLYCKECSFKRVSPEEFYAIMYYTFLYLFMYDNCVGYDI